MLFLGWSAEKLFANFRPFLFLWRSKNGRHEFFLVKNKNFFWSNNYSTKKCARNPGEEKLFLEEGAFSIKDKKVISAKFSVNISRRYVMYIIFYHYADNFWNSATFARFRNFRNSQLRESNPCHCGANSFEIMIMICNFAIFINCSNTIPNSTPFF